MASTGGHRFSLLHDDSLVVAASDDAVPAVVPWLPLHVVARADDVAAAPRALIIVDRGAAETRAEPVGVPPLLYFAGVRARLESDGTIALRGDSAAHGRLALDALHARLVLPEVRQPDDVRGRAESELYSMLTLSAALLVGRLGRALVHAGAVVDPDGAAWLLVGDTHAGKTTTCVSLVAAGWRYLADDQVVLGSDGDRGVAVEGWPRHAHLDEGWSSSVVTGARGTVDLRERWGDRWVRAAPLGGVLFPSVRAESPTETARVHSATAFAGIVRQSPWLLADGGAAQRVMELLRRAAERPAFALSVGRDSYARGEVLASRLMAARSESTPSER